MKLKSNRLSQLFFYALIFIIALEGLARFELYIAPHFLPSKRTIDSIKIRTAHGVTAKPYAKIKDIQLNKYGFNDEDDYDKEKKGAAVRILCLGDSVTFGPYTGAEPWPQQLEKKLSVMGYDVEVINAALPGVSASQLYQRLKHELLDFNPDILIYYKSYREYVGAPKNSIRVRTNWLEYSAFYRQLTQTRMKRWHRRMVLATRKALGIEELIETVQPKGTKKFEKDMLALMELTEEQGIQLVFTTFPNLVSPETFSQHERKVYHALRSYVAMSARAHVESIVFYNQIIKEMANVESIPIVDLAQKIEKDPSYFSDSYHLTEVGAGRVAEAIAESLREMI